VAGDRHSHAEDAQLLSDPDEIARREAENGLRQFTIALEMVRSYVKDKKTRAGLPWYAKPLRTPGNAPNLQ